MPDPDAVLRTVEDLTDEGTMGFRASAVARRLGSEMSEVTTALVELVKREMLRLRFDIVCPDNGRTVETYWQGESLPLGQTRHSDRCDTTEPFTVEKEHIWITFVPSEGFRARVRRQRAARQHELGSDADPEPGICGSIRDDLRGYESRGELVLQGDTYIIGNVSIMSGNRNVVGDRNVVASDEGQAAGSRAQIVGEGGVIAKGRSVQAATGGSATADRGGAAAKDAAVAASVAIRDRVRRAPWWSKFLGVICLLAVVGAMLLVGLGGDGKLTIAGFALAVVSGVAGAVPLIRG